MKLKRLLTILMVLNLMLLTACTFELSTDEGTTYKPLTPSSYSYNYFYKNSLYDFTFDFQEAKALKITVVDQSIPQNSEEKRESTITGTYSVTGKVLTIDVKSVTDDLHVFLTDTTEDEPIDLLFENDDDGNLTLAHISLLFPMLPDKITLGPTS